MKYLFYVLSLFFIYSAHAQDFYKIKERTIDGKEITMGDFKGKTLLIVNIASQCGYTSQLQDLEALFQKYKNKGLIVLGVPTNDFGGQTPEDDSSMKEFCQKKYNVTFPLLSKQTISGANKRELYKFLTEKTPKKLQGEVGWNFEKFLINKEGEVVTRMRSSMNPLDSEMTSKIEKQF
jgi:glutathione peroxidase